ncbi:MAG: hypothetical protein WC163_09100 [Sulfurovum sp.]|jgi:hypothetical protein
MSNTRNNRFLFLILMIGIFTAISFASRTVLLFTDIAQVDLGILPLFKLYAVGLFYDLVASSYYMIPPGDLSCPASQQIVQHENT